MQHLFLTKRTFDIQSIDKHIKSEWLEYDAPDKQIDEERTSLLESLLIGIVPSLFGRERSFGGCTIIKGQNVIDTYLRFKNDEFKLVGLLHFKEMEGKLYSELEYADQIKISKCELDIQYTQYEYANDEEAKSLFNHFIEIQHNLT